MEGGGYRGGGMGGGRNGEEEEIGCPESKGGREKKEVE